LSKLHTTGATLAYSVSARSWGAKFSYMGR